MKHRHTQYRRLESAPACCLFFLSLFFVSLSAQTTRIDTAYCRRLAHLLEPAGKGTVNKTATYLRLIKESLLSDPYYFYYDLAFRRVNGNAQVCGAVEREEFKLITQKVLKLLALDSLSFDISVLPLRDGAAPLFGVVHSSFSFTTSQAEGGAPMDEALYGEPVHILKKTGNAYLIKTASGYWGYARADTITPFGKDAFMRYLASTKIVLRSGMTAGGVFFPAGSMLRLQEMPDAKTYRAVTIEGRAVTVPKRRCTERRVNGEQQKQERASAVQTARGFLGTPYRLGGKNKKTGIDCSGLVQLVMRTTGRQLPRDARQQYLSGTVVGVPGCTDALQPGDLLYFMNARGQVGHTAIYIGNKEMIHATTYQKGEVQIHSIDPASPRYYAPFSRIFLGAKRVIN